MVPNGVDGPKKAWREAKVAEKWHSNWGMSLNHDISVSHAHNSLAYILGKYGMLYNDVIKPISALMSWIVHWKITQLHAL